jgi:hypothetical protein
MFQFEHLDERNRALMLSEFERDKSEKRVFFDARLKGDIHSQYLGSLERALSAGTPESFAAEIKGGEYLSALELRRQGSTEVEARVPITYPQTLAEAEFNRYYMRAVCLRAMQDGLAIEVYRAKPVSKPRPPATETWTPEALLEHLRMTNISVAGAFPGANSGKSIRLVSA